MTTPITPTGKRLAAQERMPRRRALAIDDILAIEREAAEGAGWAEMVGVARSERMKAQALADQLAEALREVRPSLEDARLWTPAMHEALRQYEEARK